VWVHSNHSICTIPRARHHDQATGITYIYSGVFAVSNTVKHSSMQWCNRSVPPDSPLPPPPIHCPVALFCGGGGGGLSCSPRVPSARLNEVSKKVNQLFCHACTTDGAGAPCVSWEHSRLFRVRYPMQGGNKVQKRKFRFSVAD
jgi:hypothetical protein